MQNKQAANNRTNHRIHRHSCVFLMVSLLLLGCHKNQLNWASLIPKLPYKTEVATDQAAVDLRKKLEKKGLTVITMGQDYLISIPSSRLFPDESPQLNWAAYPLLNDVVCYLQQFRMIAVNITGYSAQYMSVNREKALTLARAKAIANYLWSQGIDSRLLFTEGLGSDKPIIGAARQVDRSPNSRIEITFRHVIS